MNPLNPDSLNACDREPVNTPGAIQSFGALIVINPANEEIIQVSENTEAILNLSPDALLGKTITETLGSECANAVRGNARNFLGSHFTAHAWNSESVVLLEVETRAKNDTLRSEQRALDLLQAADTLQCLLETTAREVQKLTDLDRVMVYRFHEDLHGEVVAETIKPGVDSYLGLHYPATDIPLPARAVFLKNWVRMIPDVEDQAVPLRPVLNPLTGQALDLGTSLLRAVSPIHIEYLKNMGVGASLTISLIVQGKLWGLIACHSLQKKYVPLALRDACESIGRLASAFIAIKDESDTHHARTRYLEIYKILKSRLHFGNDMAAELAQQSPNLLDLITSQGSSAALYLDGYWANVGDVPSEIELNTLTAWLATDHHDEPIYATESLPTEFPAAQNFQSTPCGLLALAIPKTSHNYILWFRPEQTRTVKWAGNPEKTPSASGRLTPRSSFAEWKQTVSGKSIPWTAIEKEAALELRNGIMGVELQRQFQKEQLARQDAERAMKAREELMAILSHDLKNPIGSIKLGGKVALRFLNSGALLQVKEYLDRIDRATSNMDALINDILSITKLEAGHLDVDAKAENVLEVIEEVIEILSPIASENQIKIQTDFSHASCGIKCDRSRMIQVISNLVGNAIKFSPPSSKITVKVDCDLPEFVRITISDQGPGIDPADLKNIFDRFWQAQKTRKLGTGLGLAIARGIVVAHHGEIYAESDGKLGTQFIINLPRIPDLLS